VNRRVVERGEPRLLDNIIPQPLLPATDRPDPRSNSSRRELDDWSRFRLTFLRHRDRVKARLGDTWWRHLGALKTFPATLFIRGHMNGGRKHTSLPGKCVTCNHDSMAGSEVGSAGRILIIRTAPTLCLDTLLSVVSLHAQHTPLQGPRNPSLHSKAALSP
jgi:hypothetical protein